MPKEYKPMPSSEVLWSNFEYKPLTGDLVRISKNQRSQLQPFGSKSTKGYVFGVFQGEGYYAHRLVWAWLKGEDPGTFEVDHIDRNRSNNRFWNLRKIPAKNQTLNTGCYKNNKLGVRGVKSLPGTTRFQARIRVAGKQINLGCFATIEEASAVYERERARRISRIEEVAPSS